MLRNFEEMKMVLISSTANEWPEIDDQNLMASTNMGMEKASQDQIQQQQQQQAVLKCPRCDSTNTKFCYYNNYSLSQPRHFCKACKRYWTRGGTLRNVPVGGGCRKNKRVKRPPPASASASVVDNSPSSATTPISTTTPSTTINPLFYNTHSNSELNLSFPRFNNSRVDSGLVYDFDHFHPLGFSSGQLMANDVTSQTLLSSSYNSIPNFGSLNSSCLASPTMANSLLASNVHQQKFISGNSLGSNNNFLEFGRYEDDMQLMQGMKEVKTEDCQNKLNQIQQIGSSDPNNSVFWSAINGVGSWLDPANIDSNSVSSLI